MKKKRLTLDELHVESVRLRCSMTDAQLESINFDDWLNSHGWDRQNLEFNLALRRSLTDAMIRRGLDEDDE